MATIPPPSRLPGGEADIDYPTGDGRPVAETPIHYLNLKAAVETLDRYYQAQPMVYVWGNMLVFYEKGNRRKHVAPDRLHDGEYARSEMVQGRLPSEVTGLHFERDGEWLRLHDPLTGRWLPTTEELLHDVEAKRQRAEAGRVQERMAREQAEAERERLARQLEGSENELERMRLELEAWRRRFREQ